MMNSGGTPLYNFDAHNVYRALGGTASTVFLGVLITLSTLAIPAFAQQSIESQQPPSTSDRDRTTAADNSVLTRGTIVSLNAGTMIIRTDGGAHLVFVRDRDTASPETLRVGSRVRVISRRNSEGIHLARTVVLDGDGAAAAASPTDEPVPSDVRRIDAQIERQARRFRLGVKAGVGLDPEVLMVGAHSKMGPFFSP